MGPIDAPKGPPEKGAAAEEEVAIGPAEAAAPRRLLPKPVILAPIETAANPPLLLFPFAPTFALLLPWLALRVTAASAVAAALATTADKLSE